MQAISEPFGLACAGAALGGTTRGRGGRGSGVGGRRRWRGREERIPWQPVRLVSHCSLHRTPETLALSFLSSFPPFLLSTFPPFHLSFPLSPEVRPILGLLFLPHFLFLSSLLWPPRFHSFMGCGEGRRGGRRGGGWEGVGEWMREERDGVCV
jgi:hypothetical protein